MESSTQPKTAHGIKKTLTVLMLSGLLFSGLTGATVATGEAQEAEARTWYVSGGVWNHGKTWSHYYHPKRFHTATARSYKCRRWEKGPNRIQSKKYAHARYWAKAGVKRRCMNERYWVLGNKN